MPLEHDLHIYNLINLYMFSSRNAEKNKERRPSAWRFLTLQVLYEPAKAWSQGAPGAYLLQAAGTYNYTMFKKYRFQWHNGI